MNTYGITEITRRYYFFEVEANSPDEAQEKLRKGDYKRCVETNQLPPQYKEPILLKEQQ